MWIVWLLNLFGIDDECASVCESAHIDKIHKWIELKNYAVLRIKIGKKFLIICAVNAFAECNMAILGIIFITLVYHL